MAAPVISVVGPSSCSKEEAAIAKQLGQTIAERGAVLVCGGRGGVMHYACQGAIDGGGITIGVLPGADPGSGNPHLTVALPTGLGEARNAIVAQAGQSVIAVGGGAGTLSEIALAVKAGRRVVVLNSWQSTLPGGQPLPVIIADSPEHAVELALVGSA